MSNQSQQGQRPAPAGTYKGVPIYLYRSPHMQPDEWGASFEWHGRLTDAQVEEWQRPTQENILQAARDVIRHAQRDRDAGNAGGRWASQAGIGGAVADIFAQAEAAKEHGLLVVREKACYLYVSALDRGDLTTVAAILHEAEGDPVLDEMLSQIDEALHEEMQEQSKGKERPSHD